MFLGFEFGGDCGLAIGSWLDVVFVVWCNMHFCRFLDGHVFLLGFRVCCGCDAFGWWFWCGYTLVFLGFQGFALFRVLRVGFLGVLI